MAEIFVSYAREDRDAARSIIDALQSAGFYVHREDSAGEDSDAHPTLAQIESVQCVICLWSKSAAQSASVQEDIHGAIHAWSEGRLILATLDATELPVGLRDLQGVPVRRRPTGLDTTELLAAVRLIVDQSRDRPIPEHGEVASLARPRPARSLLRVPLLRRRAFVASAVAAALVLGAGGFTATWMSLKPEPPVETTVSKKRTPTARPPGGLPQMDVVPPAQPAPAPVPPRVTPKTSAEIPPPPVRAPPVAPPAPGPAGGLTFLLAMLALGVAIGAGSMWAWSMWARRRSERALPMAAPPPVSAVQPVTAPIHHVFVSYSRQDGSAVEELVKHIEQAGYTVWIDRHSTGSQRYAAPIVRAIKTSQLVALMCSQNAFGSDHVIREVYVAGDYKKPFIAFQLDHSEFPDDVLYFVSGFPRVRTEALDIQQLRSEIARLVAA